MHSLLQAEVYWLQLLVVRDILHQHFTNEKAQIVASSKFVTMQHILSKKRDKHISHPMD